jgi:hypothetical protein
MGPGFYVVMRRGDVAAESESVDASGARDGFEAPLAFRGGRGPRFARLVVSSPPDTLPAIHQALVGARGAVPSALPAHRPLAGSSQDRHHVALGWRAARARCARGLRPLVYDTGGTGSGSRSPRREGRARGRASSTSTRTTFVPRRARGAACRKPTPRTSATATTSASTSSRRPTLESSWCARSLQLGGAGAAGSALAVAAGMVHDRAALAREVRRALGSNQIP